MFLTKREHELRELMNIVESPPVEWQGRCDSMTSQQKDAMIRELDSLIQRMAMLSAYVGRRYGYGCGDQGHDSGVKEANKRLTAVRKALGYTYPGRGGFTF